MKANKKTVKKVAPVKRSSQLETMKLDLEKAIKVLNDMYYNVGDLKEFAGLPVSLRKAEDILDRACAQLDNLYEALSELKDATDLDAKVSKILDNK